MICLHCGYCCKEYMVVIVDDPEKGIKDNNLIVYNGNSQCKHLSGDQPGKYTCAIHHYPWYKKTPCYSHGQIETSKNDKCRMGEFVLKRKYLNELKGTI